MSIASAESFKVWAADYTPYGPVDLATLTQWIQDGLVLADTFVQTQSDLRWRQATEIPLLRDKFPPSGDTGGAEAASTASALRGFSIFAGLSDAELEQLAALGKSYEVAPPELIVRKGDPCDSVYFVLSGELRVRLLIGLVDQQDKTLAKLGSGEFFGELGMFLQSQRTADVIAESQSRLFRISVGAFQLLVKQMHELASPILFNLGVTMAKRIAEDNKRLYQEVTSNFLWS